MKIKYLLIWLIVLCAAGTGAINSSGGSIDGRNSTTPFLIFGHVCYEDNAPCEGQTVDITNTNTGMSWQAETDTNYSYYELVIDSANVTAGDAIEWSATVGTVVNTTNYTVIPDDLDSGGIFNFNLTLASGAPVIMGCAPLYSPVRDTENATRTFNITIDQTMNVTWRVNGTIVQTNNSVTDASYTNRSAVIGVRNVSAVARNENGTAMQEWIWHVTPPARTPSPPIFVLYGKVFYNETKAPVDAPYVVITNLKTGRTFVADIQLNFYQLITNASEIRVNDTLLFNASKDGELIGRVNYTVTENDSGAIRLDINRGWADLQVLAILPPEYIFSDGRNNTIAAVIANNGTTSTDGFNVSLAVDGNVTDSASIESLTVGGTGNVTFNWIPDGIGNHTLTVTADVSCEIDESDEGNNSMSTTVFVGVPDLTVTNIGIVGYVLDPECPLYNRPTFEYPNNVTAAVANIGNRSADAAVEFYCEPDISKAPISRWFSGYGNSSNDTITQPNASRMRVHFSYLTMGTNSDVEIYDKDNNTVETIKVGGSRWSNWVDSDVIRMHAYIGGTGESIWFNVDQYEYIFADATVSLEANKSVNISRIWYANVATITNETKSRYVAASYTISVTADPNNAVTELNESNNTFRRSVADMASPYDFTVTNLTLSPDTLREGEPVTIVSAIGNNGLRSIDTDVAIYVDGNLIATEDIYSEINKTEVISTIWDALPDINNPTTKHEITVVVDPNDLIEEQNEYNNTMTKLLNVIRPDFTITDITTDPELMILGDTVDVIATIKNNEDKIANSTVWFCEEHSVSIGGTVTHPRSNPGTSIHEITEFIPHEDALMMRAYVIVNANSGEEGSAHTDIYVNGREVLSCQKGSWSGWTEWTSGSNMSVDIRIECTSGGAEYQNDYNISEYQTVFGNTTITIPASESVHPSMNWTVIQKNPTLIVNTSTVTNSTDIYVGGTDLAVTDVSVAYDLWGGDMVDITARVTNFGRMNASNFALVFDDMLHDVVGERRITKIDIPGLDAGDSMNITVPWTASLKVGADISHNRTIRVEAKPQDSSVEDNPENNIRYSDNITVKRSRDFSVTGIEFFKDNETVDPDNLEIGLLSINASVGVTNLASCSGSVDLICYLDNTTQINTTRAVSFPAGSGTIYAEFAWDVCDHGGHTITVIADQKDETSEFDESNNAFSQSIYIRAPDFTVMDLTFDPESPEVGDTVKITTTVGNLGNKDEDDVTVRYIIERDEWIESPHDYPGNWSYNCTVHAPGAHKMRLSLTMHLRKYSDYVSVYDANGDMIERYDQYSYTPQFGKYPVAPPFERTTDWIDGDSAIVELVSLPGGGMEFGSKNWGFSIDRVDMMFENQTSLDLGENKTISVQWNATQAGPHPVTVTIDPKNIIPESDESNNTRTGTLTVHGADLTVSDMRVTANGAKINGTETVIIAGDAVTVSAVVTNIGIRPASNFSVIFCTDDTEFANQTNMSLDAGTSVNVSAEWDSIIGNYTITVAADSLKQIYETNESNNTVAMDVCVEGADILVTSLRWTVILPPNATANDTCYRMYDTDIIQINTGIANQGILPARNFSTHIFYQRKGIGSFDKKKADGDKRANWKWYNRTLKDAGCVYVNIGNAANIKNNIKIYDRNSSLAASPEGDGWFFVCGDEANVRFNSVHGVGISVDFYAGDFKRYEHQSLETGQYENLTMQQQVFTGDHAIRVFVDPEDNVCEDSEENNYADMALIAHPSRDFTVNDLRLSYDGSLIGLNDTILDGGTVLVEATVGMGVNESDPYHEYRTGDVDVTIIDEHEWVKVSPRFELTPYGYAQVITYPGADAMKMHFEEMGLPMGGWIYIRDKNGTMLWSRSWIGGSTDESPWMDGDTVYVYKVERSGWNEWIWGRITCSIDRYQYKRLDHTNVSLDAGGNETIANSWDMSAGNHTMQATADTEDVVGEINESNNEICKTLSVDACKDPAVLNISCDPLKPAVGSDVLINATIINRGDKTVNFTVDLWAEKTEYHPLDPPHLSEFPHGNYEWGIPSTYPDADWMGIHFRRIDMYTEAGEFKYKRDLYLCDNNDTIADNFCGSVESDVWAWVKGDMIKLKTTPSREGSTGVVGYGPPVWGFEIDLHRYRILLNRTTLTLEHNETANVTGILENVRAGNHSMDYTIYARLDMNNTVYETDESNNEMARILNLAVPDYTVTINPTKDGVIRAKFRNTGLGSADVRVFFSRDMDVEDSVGGTWFRYVPNASVRKSVDWTDDVEWTRIHFKEMEIENGYMKVGNERYEESKSDFWSPWVKGDRVRLDYRHARSKIDMYDFAEEDFIDDFGGGDHKYLDIPWEGYTEPYNLTVWIDPLDELLEGNEDNNNDTTFVYADLSVDYVWPEDLTPHLTKWSLDVETLGVNGFIRNGGGDRDCIVAPVSDFDVTLEFRYPNGTIVSNMTKHVEGAELLYANERRRILFEFDPEDMFEVGGNYTMELVVDSADDISESDEENNVMNRRVFVYNSSGYTGGGELVNVAQGEVFGRMVYTSTEGDTLDPGEKCTLGFDDIIPSSVDVDRDIDVARLFVYWGGMAGLIPDDGTPPKKFVPRLDEVDVSFNDCNNLVKAGNYSDHPGATRVDVAYGLYTYDVTDCLNKVGNEVVITNRATDWPGRINAVGLLVVCRDKNEPLIKYWINEGADVVWAGGPGISSDDCITTAIFGYVERDDIEDANVSLLTVLSAHSGRVAMEPPTSGGDSLKLNDQSIGSPMGTGYWKSVRGVHLTENKWEDVTDHLMRGVNLVEIRSKGNFMMPVNAFLRLIFPPDLAVINLTAPESTVVGAHHQINVTIKNEGRGGAHDFNVTLYIDGMKMVRIPHLDLPAGENMTLHLYNWTPKMLGRMYNLTAAADVITGADWTEIETDNNAMTKYVRIEQGGLGNSTGPRGEGGGSNPSGGKYADEITGRVMQGVKFLTLGGGGSLGMFSVRECIMKFVVWLMLLLFVYAGYRTEQRGLDRVRGYEQF